jgi:RecJ-like exonuclease
LVGVGRGQERTVMADQERDKPKPNPGDQAAPGTRGTGENVCPTCKGSGRVEAKACETCGGTGKVIEGVGGA